LKSLERKGGTLQAKSAFALDSSTNLLDSSWEHHVHASWNDNLEITLVTAKPFVFHRSGVVAILFKLLAADAAHVLST